MDQIVNLKIYRKFDDVYRPNLSGLDEGQMSSELFVEFIPEII